MICLSSFGLERRSISDEQLNGEEKLNGKESICLSGHR